MPSLHQQLVLARTYHVYIDSSKHDFKPISMFIFFRLFSKYKCRLKKIMITLLVTFVHSCKDEGIHREFKKQCGASCVYYNDELAVLVVLVSDLKPYVKNVLIYNLCLLLGIA